PTTGTIFDNPSAPGIAGNYLSGNLNIKTASSFASLPASSDGLVSFYYDNSYTQSTGNFSENGTFYIQVTDSDQNFNSSSADTVTVKVTNISTGETENVSLTETGIATGIFRGSLLSSTDNSYNTNNSGRLTALTGNSVKVEYTDPISGATTDNPTTPGSNANTDTAALAKTKTLYFADNSLGFDGIASTEDDGSLTDLIRVVPTGSTTITTATISPSATAGSYYYYDKFSSSSYKSTSSTSSGTSGYTNKSWTTTWTEFNDNNQPSSGVIQASKNSNSLIFGSSTGLIFTGSSSSDVAIYRSIDLTGLDATQSVNLTFDYGTNQLSATGEKISLQISKDGGSTYTTIQEFTGDTGSSSSAFSQDIKSYLTGASNLADVRFKFIGSGLTAASDNKADFQIDNFKLLYKTGTAVIPAIFEQSLALSEDFNIPQAGLVSITSYVSGVSNLTSGNNYSTISAALTWVDASNQSHTIANMGSALYTQSSSGLGTLTWKGEVPSTQLV
ncbi:MAG: hypothetical protein EBR59_10280, partial [Methylococcaceae bacterium]|nr:hypothetical protein [Methylococcaceae bacterium]